MSLLTRLLVFSQSDSVFGGSKLPIVYGSFYVDTDATNLLSKCMSLARYKWLNMLVVGGRKLRQKFRPL